MLTSECIDLDRDEASVSSHVNAQRSVLQKCGKLDLDRFRSVHVGMRVDSNKCYGLTWNRPLGMLAVSDESLAL